MSGKSGSFPYSLCIQKILELKPVDISRIDRDGWVSVDTDGHYVTDFKQNLPPRCDPKDQITIVASSVLSGGNYNQQNVWDKDPSTAWVEGDKGDGIGEWLDFWLYRKKQTINSISIINGYVKNETIYNANNRVKKVRIWANNGDSYLFDLEDNNLQKQILKLPKPINASTLKIIIVDIYKGSKYNDTSISEVELN